MGELESLVMGFSIAAIPGPIFFEIIRRVLAKGFWHGMAVLLGEFAGNLLLLSIIYLGAGSLLTSPGISPIFYLASAAILLYLGISALRLKKEELDAKSSKKSSKAGPFVAGFGISASSPIVIAFWISLSGSYLAGMQPASAITNILLLCIGFLPFHMMLAAFINRTRHMVPIKYMLWLSRIFGVILCLYGLSFIYRLLA